MQAFKDKIATIIPVMQEKVAHIIRDHGDVIVAEVTIKQLYGGVRGVKCLLCETSMLDPYEGVRYRGYSLPELKNLLPKAKGGDEPLPEGVFHLFMTGTLPTENDVEYMRQLWNQHRNIPMYIFQLIETLPKDMHPMTQMSLAILGLQKYSQFSKQYNEGLAKKDLWEPALEDVIYLIPKLPILGAYIYRRIYKGGQSITPDPNLDWSANYAHLLGNDDPEFYELMRLFLTLHADHEGGNVSAHTAQVVGSTLADPFYALSSAINGLAGPLHGLANQEVLHWINMLQKHFQTEEPSKEQIKSYVWDTLNSDRVIPGYGHAVLRRTDPRYQLLREFSQKHLPDDALFRIVSTLYEIVPEILRQQGKAKNPWPNVDAHSGCVLVHYGIKEHDYFTVLFGISRAVGILSWFVWSRILSLPLERPKSVTTEYLESLVVQWTDDLKVGIAPIDYDHQALISKIQELIQSYNFGKGSNAIETLFSFLEEYTHKHFEREESYMKKYNYPYIDDHIRQHDNFKDIFKSVYQEYSKEGGSVRMIILIKQMLMDWFTHHITKIDKAMVTFLKDKHPDFEKEAI